MAILRFRLTDNEPEDGQAVQLVHIDGLDASGGGTSITDVVVNMLDADGTASGSVSGTTLTLNVPRGATGAAATVEVGSVTSGDTASVTNSGTSSAATLDFVLPKGDRGDAGAAATVEVGDVTTGEAGSSAAVSNSGTGAAARLDFTIPRGDKGETGAHVNGIALTVTDGVVTAGRASLSDGNSFDINITNVTTGDE